MTGSRTGTLPWCNGPEQVYSGHGAGSTKNRSWPASIIILKSVKAFYILDGSYIDAALDEITRQYGSVEEYAQQRLGLSSEEIDQLREVLLE
jgi:hypothetical protein